MRLLLKSADDKFATDMPALFIAGRRIINEGSLVPKFRGQGGYPKNDTKSLGVYRKRDASIATNYLPAGMAAYYMEWSIFIKLAAATSQRRDYYGADFALPRHDSNLSPVINRAARLRRK